MVSFGFCSSRLVLFGAFPGSLPTGWFWHLGVGNSIQPVLRYLVSFTICWSGVFGLGFWQDIQRFYHWWHSNLDHKAGFCYIGQSPAHGFSEGTEGVSGWMWWNHAKMMSESPPKRENSSPKSLYLIEILIIQLQHLNLQQLQQPQHSELPKTQSSPKPSAPRIDFLVVCSSWIELFAVARCRLVGVFA